jgi:hypothetical protein
MHSLCIKSPSTVSFALVMRVCMTQWQDILAGLFYLRLSGRRGPFNPADYIGLASQAAFHVFSISSLAGPTSTMLLVHAALLVLLVVGMAGKYIRW